MMRPAVWDAIGCGAFGRRLADLGIKKATLQGRIYYRGLVLDADWRPAAGAAAERGQNDDRDAPEPVEGRGDS